MTTPAPHQPPALGPSDVAPGPADEDLTRLRTAYAAINHGSRHSCTREDTMIEHVTFHAEKPLLATHPVNGGDALIFSIAPPPPRWWWRAMRRRAAENDTLLRPWDQEQESRVAVVCPSLADLTAVIDAVDICVAQANADYKDELDLQRASAARFKTDEADRDQYLADVRHAIDERYDADGDATRGVAADSVGSDSSTERARTIASHLV